jgi:two-component system response regulator PilR (NtrC family)
MDDLRVLAVDDEKSMRDLLSIILKKEGLRADVAATREEVTGFLARHRYGLVITDIKMPNFSGLEVLRMVRESCQETKVILITAYASADTAIEAMKLGAFDYITKPFKVDEIKRLIHSALQQARAAVDSRAAAGDEAVREVGDEAVRDFIVGDSKGILEICKMIGKVANRKSTVLITGESGTGKELIARAIHHNSDRKGRPFLTVNCGALTDTLLESELFGHLKGSFTGAITDKKGLFEAADGGTFFLDEISETSKSFQVKLLRVLQEQVIKRVGDTRDVRVDVRIIAATNRDLQAMIMAGEFREDLFFRLNVISIHVPPLRERREDVAKLAEHFLRKYQRQPSDPVRISQEAMGILQDHVWPGNVRELENVIERAMAMAGSETIGPDALPPSLPARVAAPASVLGLAELPAEGVDLEALLHDLEQHYLRRALEQAGGNMQEAARLLGLSLRSLRYRLAKGRGEEPALT